jgi:soluble lytic murein transglycosylase
MLKNKLCNKINNKKTKKILLITFLIIILILIGWLSVKTFMYPLKHFDIIKEEAAKNNIDPYLVLAIIKTESGFDKDVTSPKQAKGLMQIMDSTAQEMIQDSDINLDEDSIYDENVNIALGCKYLSSLIKKYNGNYYLAIISYNAGMGNLDSWIEEGIISEDLDSIKNVNIPFSETKKYLKRVIVSYKIYRFLY